MNTDEDEFRKELLSTETDRIKEVLENEKAALIYYRNRYNRHRSHKERWQNNIEQTEMYIALMEAELERREHIYRKSVVANVEVSVDFDVYSGGAEATGTTVKFHRADPVEGWMYNQPTVYYDITPASIGRIKYVLESRSENLSLDFFEMEAEALRRELNYVKQENELFAKCMRRALKLWKAEHTNANYFPDGAVNFAWLLGKVEQLEEAKKAR